MFCEDIMAHDRSDPMTMIHGNMITKSCFLHQKITSNLEVIFWCRKSFGNQLVMVAPRARPDVLRRRPTGSGVRRHAIGGHAVGLGLLPLRGPLRENIMICRFWFYNVVQSRRS